MRMICLSLMLLVVCAISAINQMEEIFTLQGEQYYGSFGRRLAAIDINADGHEDLAVLQSRWVPDSLAAVLPNATGRNWGRILFYYGGQGFDANPDFVIEGQRPYHYNYCAVNGFGNIGDFDGDGWDDFALLADGSDIEVFYSNPTPSGNPDYTFHITLADQDMGIYGSFEALGDINIAKSYKI